MYLDKKYIEADYDFSTPVCIFSAVSVVVTMASHSSDTKRFHNSHLIDGILRHEGCSLVQVLSVYSTTEYMPQCN